MKQGVRTIALAAAAVLVVVANRALAKPPGAGGGPKEVVVRTGTSNPGSVMVGNGAEAPVPIVNVAPQVLSIRSAALPISL